jgi:hypothetical protein
MSKHGWRPSLATGTATKVVSALVSFAVLYSIFLTTIPASAAPDPACDFAALSPGTITATVASEFPDYLAGATVNLTGFGFAPGEIVCYRVSEDNPVETWNLKDSTLSDGSGNLAFSFAISADFIAQYRVRAWGLTSGAYAETTFTDAPGSTNKVYQHWADGDPPGVGAEWNNNILNDNKSSYFEGEVIPHVFEYKASSQTPLTNGQSYSINVTYNYYQSNTNAGGFAYMTTFNLSRTPGPNDATNPYVAPGIDSTFTNGGGTQGSFYTVDADITSVSGVSYSAGDGHVTITFTYTGTTTTNGLAEIYYGLYIAQPGQVPDQGSGTTKGAAAWTGGSLQTTVDIGGSGATSIQLSPSAIIVGQISGVKFNDLDGDGVKDQGEPLLPGWTVYLCADSACNTILQTTTTGANGAYSFSVTPDADKTTPANDPYYVREVNQSGWTQTAPTTVYYGPLTVSATTPQYLNQDFGNQKDQGYLKISKVFDPKTSGFIGNFTIKYNCGAGDQTVSLAAGTSTTVGPFDAGTSCTVSEPTVPTAPSGWAFGSPTLNPINGQVTIVKGNQASAVTVEVTNTITRDTGSLKIKKIFAAGSSGFGGTFAINYDCNDGTAHDGTANLAAGGETTISGIPTGTECTVSEPNTPTPPTGWTFGTPTLADNQAPTDDGKVTINDKAATYTVEVTNTITRDTGSLTIVKKVVNDNGGSATVNAFGINTSAGSLTFDAGAANGTTTTYTSQKLTVVTDTYTLKENDVYGYAEGTWSCTGAAGTVVPTFDNGSAQVGKGENVTCTIINNDQPGTIIVQKIIKPVGALTSFTFNTTGTGYNGFSLAGGQQNSQTLNAGSYTVKELVPLGWVLTGIGGAGDPTPYNCTVTGSGGSTGVGDLNTQTATVNLKNGDTVTCVFENTGQGATRTQGFWATHSQLANIAWFGGTAYGHTFPGVAGVAGIGDVTLCGRPIDTLGKLMGAFWSDVSKTSTGVKRSALDQARMQLLQQLLAAELNASAFGSVPSGGSGQFAVWEAAYCGTNQNLIKNAQQGAASFNTVGDSSTFTPGTSADSKNARAIADRAFWDLLP